jgi:DNA-binding transcriptional MerR regulator
MRIGEVAVTAGCNIQTLRYYERRGLLPDPGRTAAGYREYPSDTVRLIRFIKRAQELGFTLGEVEELLKLRGAKGRERRKVRSLAEAKMRDIESKVVHLQAINRALSGLVGSCRTLQVGARCPILDALNDTDTIPTKNGGKRNGKSRT